MFQVVLPSFHWIYISHTFVLFNIIFVPVGVCMNASWCSTCVPYVIAPVIESSIVNRFPAWLTCANKFSTMSFSAKDAVWPSFYSTSYIRDSRIGLALATPIGLTFSSFDLFLTLANSGLYPSWYNFKSILTYWSYRSAVKPSSTSLAYVFLNTLLNSSLKSLLLSDSSYHISIVGLLLFLPANVASSYFSCNRSWIASSNTLNLYLLASVHVSRYMIRYTDVRNTVMPLAGRIQYLVSDPTRWDGPRNSPILFLTILCPPCTKPDHTIQSLGLPKYLAFLLSCI